MEYRNINAKSIDGIDKCVAEFNVSVDINIPYDKFKVKVFEQRNGRFEGYTNLLLKDDDEDRCSYPGVGNGATIEEALKKTIEYFFSIIDERENLVEDDFEWADPYDF